MKGFELVKREDHWALYNEDGHKIASTLDGCNSKLSIKNCEEIERGYDLDELADKYFISEYSWNHKDTLPYKDKDVELSKTDFKKGFQKALEIIGDKKFSEDDILKAIEMYYGKDKIFIEIIQSLQQTEFDVEIVMDKDCYSSAGRCDKLIMADCIICTPVTYLRDENGCLILKRV